MDYVELWAELKRLNTALDEFETVSDTSLQTSDEVHCESTRQGGDIHTCVVNIKRLMGADNLPHPANSHWRDLWRTCNEASDLSEHERRDKAIKHADELGAWAMQYRRRSFRREVLAKTANQPRKVLIALFRHSPMSRAGLMQRLFGDDEKTDDALRKAIEHTNEALHKAGVTTLRIHREGVGKKAQFMLRGSDGPPGQK